VYLFVPEKKLQRKCICIVAGSKHFFSQTKSKSLSRMEATQRQSSSDRMSSPDGTQDSCIAMDSMDSIAGVDPGNQDGQAKGRMLTSVAPRMELGGHCLTFLDESLSGTAGYNSSKEEEAENLEDEVNKTAANKVEDAKTPEGISEYEKLRHRNIWKNNARLRAIGLDKSFPLKRKKAIKKKIPPSLSVPTIRNPSRVEFEIIPSGKQEGFL
jgi:hypothetical protein